MKTRIGALIILVATLWGCGAAPTEVRQDPPVSPVVTVVGPPHPTPTPSCRIHKLCEGT